MECDTACRWHMFKLTKRAIACLIPNIGALPGSNDVHVGRRYDERWRSGLYVSTTRSHVKGVMSDPVESRAQMMSMHAYTGKDAPLRAME